MDSDHEPKSDVCKPPPSDKAKWQEWVAREFKPWAQRGGRKAQWVLETDQNIRTKLRPAGLTAPKVFEAQLVIFNELKRLFYHDYKSLIDRFR